jgi:catechol 2,3-dioxygenase-like lactoylglutathione lyase family enzyme
LQEDDAMNIERLATVLPVPDLAAAVTAWSALLGVEPTFVDGDRWAQFDVAGARIALAGSDRTGDEPGLMAKVPDLDAALAELAAQGLQATAPQEGPHEIRATVTGPGGVPVVLYAPRAVGS